MPKTLRVLGIEVTTNRRRNEVGDATITEVLFGGNLYRIFRDGRDGWYLEDANLLLPNSTQGFVGFKEPEAITSLVESHLLGSLKPAPEGPIRKQQAEEAERAKIEQAREFGFITSFRNKGTLR